ncbi:MAG: alpha-ketoglutarate-dependent dioxygenase AlkB [Sphingomonadales bacterium]|nr:MAG: alpha-ketoglutarate-dependent dioxygenase AlkB [Sphingomonadales bacterium]
MFAGQADLFASRTLPGLDYRDDLISPAEEQALIAEIQACDLAPFAFQGWLGKRLTASFGWRYDFENASFAPATPIPDWLLPPRASAAEFAGLSPEALVQALLIRYDPGAGIGWHRDRPVFEHVVGISLGAPATLRLRKRLEKGFERFPALLQQRSVYHLSKEARHSWEHSIAPMDVPRWSVTFRSLSDTGLRMAR